MIVLTLPYPVSANRYWKTAARGGRAMTYVSGEAKDYRAKVAAIARARGIFSPMYGRVEVAVQLYPHRPLDHKKRMRDHGAAWDDTVSCIDLDNANKVLLDSLKGVVIQDDKWVRRLTSERMEPDGEARVVLYVRSMPVPVLQQPLVA